MYLPSSLIATCFFAVGGLAHAAQVSLENELLSEYGASFEQLSVDVKPETASRLHIKVYPTREERWEVPEAMVPR